MKHGRGANPNRHQGTRGPGNAIPEAVEPDLVPGRVELLDARAPFLLPLTLLLIARVFFMLAQPYASEDAYITFRYAARWVAGHGLTYNPGEHVLGFTSPLWTLWCGIGLALRVNPVPWTQITSIVADVCTLVVGAQLLRTQRSGASAWAFAMFFACWPLFSASAVSGLEMNTVIALLMLATALAVRRSRGAGWVLGLLAVSRPEGLLAAVLIGVIADTRARFVAGGVFALTAAGLFSWFHTVLPQSVVAKAVLYGTPGPWTGRHWWDWLVPFPMGRYPTSSEGIQLMPLALVFGAALMAGIARLWVERSLRLAAFAIAGLAVWLGYVTLGVAYFWWYLPLPLAALGWTAALGLPEVVRGRTLPALCIVVLLGVWITGLPLYLGRAQTEYENFAGAAEFLKVNSQPEQRVLLEPIGWIGYETGMHVFDEVGLVTPEVVRRRLNGAGWYADMVAEHRPEWLVVRPEVFTDRATFAGAGAPFRGPGERDNILAHYRAVWPSVPQPGITLRVFRRTD